jgi:hypothetical protein
MVFLRWSRGSLEGREECHAPENLTGPRRSPRRYPGLRSSPDRQRIEPPALPPLTASVLSLPQHRAASSSSGPQQHGSDDSAGWRWWPEWVERLHAARHDVPNFWRASDLPLGILALQREHLQPVPGADPLPGSRCVPRSDRPLRREAASRHGATTLTPQFDTGSHVGFFDFKRSRVSNCHARYTSSAAGSACFRSEMNAMPVLAGSQRMVV